jgi:hypothetical protein
MFADEVRDLRFDFLLHARCERLSVEHTCRHTEMVSPSATAPYRPDPTAAC